MDVRIRRARESDLDAVGRITVEAYVDDGFMAADDDYLDELGDADRRAREAEVWVAVQDDEVLGSVTYCLPGTPFAELSRPGEGEFRMLAVARSARRRGIARALVLRCVARSEELGHSAIVLCSLPEMTAAHRLYETLGFHRLPERDWSPAQGVSLIGFIRPLGGADR